MRVDVTGTESVRCRREDRLYACVCACARARVDGDADVATKALVRLSFHESMCQENATSDSHEHEHDRRRRLQKHRPPAYRVRF